MLSWLWRWPGQTGPNRHSVPMVTLSFVSMNNTPSIGYYHTIKRGLHRGRCNQGATANMRGPRAENHGPVCLGLVRSSVLLVLTDWLKMHQPRLHSVSLS